ncbi:MAG: hypothetical protein ACFFDN_36525 [Candidatus Hodarchaeota archaeon]
MLKESKDKLVIKSQKIEELEKKIIEIEPVVKRMRDIFDKELKELIAERNVNLMKLFDKEERKNNSL